MTEPAAPTVEAPTASPEELAVLAEADRFGFDLYARLKRTPGNLVFSPASLSVALGMAYGGARGQTATELGRTLRFEGAASPEALHRAYGAALHTWNTTGTATLRVANRIFVDNAVPLEASFVALTRETYRAEAERVAFAAAPEPARAHINQWIADQTEQRIRDLLPAGSIDMLTRLVLTNAVYFKGSWETQFEPARTRPMAFSLSRREQADVPMMQTKARFRYARTDGVRVLEMPYAGGELGMLWIVPEAAHGLAALEERLTAERVRSWRAAATMVEVDVRIPRFRLEPGTLALSDTLKAMGMRLPFDPRRADFTGIATLPDGLFISNVFHKAFIEVNEEGTEAAAATAVVMATRGMAAPAPEPPRFYADQPFLFMLVDQRTGATLFLGRVSDPR